VYDTAYIRLANAGHCMFAKSDRPVLSCLKIRSRICRLYDTHGSCANVFPLMSQLPSRFEGAMLGHMAAWWSFLSLRHHHHGTFLRHVSEVR
jgi:hypothetical protein